MTAQSAIHELKQVRQYCSARAIPAIDYAIQVLQGLAEREKRVEEAKQANPQSPQDPAEAFPDSVRAITKQQSPIHSDGALFFYQKRKENREYLHKYYIYRKNTSKKRKQFCNKFTANERALSNGL